MKLPQTKKQRQKGILFVDKNNITYYLKGNHAPFNLELPVDAVEGMEVVNPEKFVGALAFWMDNNKIADADIIIVVSENVYFEHAVQSLANSDEDEKDLEMFLGTVPLEDPVSKVIVDGASKKVVVLSRDYYDLLLDFLEKRYFRVLALFPASLLGIKSPNDINIEQLIKNLDDYKKYNFLGDFERRFIPQSFIAKNTPKDTRNLKIMLGLFGVLVIILIVLVYTTFIRG